MRRLVPVVAVLLTSVGLFPSTTPVSACPYVVTARAAESSDIIVVGTIQAKNLHTYTLEAHHYFKGTGPTHVSIADVQGPPGSLPSESSLGETLLLFLSDYDEAETSETVYYSNPCKGALLPDGDTEAQPALLLEVGVLAGHGHPPNDAPPLIPNTGDFRITLDSRAAPSLEPDHPDPPREVMWLAAALIPLAFLAAATLARWRRR